MHFNFLQGGVYIGKLYCKTSNKTLRDNDDGCTQLDHLGWHNRNRIASISAIFVLRKVIKSQKVKRQSLLRVILRAVFTVHFVNVNNP
jgi:hypothetical protein